jgi:DNA-binding response OmpR family regulator
MPGLSGDEVLRELRDREVRTRVVMVTAVDPDLGVVEMPFDDYLCKPVAREDVRATVDHQCRVLAYQLLGEYFELAAKRAVVAADPATDGASPDVAARADRLAERVRGLLPEAAELVGAFDEVDREGY